MLTLEQETLLKRYAEAVVGAPSHLHLTADRDLRTFWLRHVMDAKQLLEMLPPTYRVPGTRVLDVGSGNGVPGIPLAIMEPQWNIEMLDSDTKKCGFLDMFCKKMGIKNARVIVGRAEPLAQGALREQYNLVFARALSKLPVAIELCGGFVAMDGFLIVPHGTSWETELKESKQVIDVMGLALLQAVPYVLEKVSFRALIFKKIKATLPGYPRGVGVPEKNPL